MIATAIAAALIVDGVVALRRSRLRAYRPFELAVLVDLFLAKPFEFFASGFAVAALVVADLALLASLRYLTALERRPRAGVAPATTPASVIPQPIV
jgi:hypothetical protein